MQAIVTAIDDPWRDELEGIWGELKAVFGLKSLIGTNRPYLTFHVAEEYAAGLRAELAGVAAKGTPFAIETHGIGVTQGEQAVIYVHVTRTEALDDVHHVIHHVAQPLAFKAKAAYESETWVPHIALATGRVSDDEIAQIMSFLDRRTYEWRMTATNLCLIPDTRLIEAEWTQFDLRGTPTPS